MDVKLHLFLLLKKGNKNRVYLKYPLYLSCFPHMRKIPVIDNILQFTIVFLEQNRFNNITLIFYKKI